MPRMGQAAAALESAADMIQGMLKPICTLYMENGKDSFVRFQYRIAHAL